MWSGGSIRSVSLISSLCTVIVHVVPAGRCAFGVRVIVVAGEEDCEKASGVPVGHSSENAFDVALTDSLKLTSMVEPRATSVAPSAGEVLVTLGAASCVVNEKLEFAAGWSGGSPVSTSLIWFAITFTEQIVASGRSLVGSSVIDEPGEPLTVKLSGVPVGHSTVNELPDAVTGSLKFTTMFVFTATCVAASAGEVLVTEGAASDVVKLKM